MTNSIPYDATKCIGCRGCQAACKQWYELPAEITRNRGSYQNPPRLSAKTCTLIQFRELEGRNGLVWAFTKRQCMHCLEPACVSACPVGALHKTADGPVLYDDRKCIGCRYCMVACPFNVPKFEWNKGLLAEPVIRKCQFCFDRLAEGMEPACVKACPTGALKYGDREALLAEAHARIRRYPDHYVNHVYGEHEAGGTSVLYLSSVPFEEVGLPKLPPKPLPSLSEEVMSGTVPFALGWSAVLAGVYWAVKRRNEGMGHNGKSHEPQEKEAL